MITSHKDSLEVLNSLIGLRIDRADAFLERVLKHEQAIPYKKKNSGVAHRKGMGSGKYSDKTVKLMLGVLRNASANAQSKGLDLSKTFVTHAAAHRGLFRRPGGSRVFPKGPQNHSRRSNVEITLEER